MKTSICCLMGPVLTLCTALWADDCPPSTHRIVYRTEYEQQEVTAYRLECEIQTRHVDVTSTHPVWETETRTRRYTVARPVWETQTREERHRVMRPVWETETRQEQYSVRRPVTETVMQSQNSVAYEPVTTMRTEYVDQGSCVDQLYYAPGAARNRLTFLPGGYVTDPASGSMIWRRGGLYWVPTQAPGAYAVQRQYIPNLVAQQVPQTTYVQKVVTQQVPTQITRYVDEVVCKPVQVQVCKYVEQEIVRPIQISTQRIEYEQREEPVQVQVCRYVTEVKSVPTQHTVSKWVPFQTTRMVPKTVALRVPVAECGGCGVTAYYPPSTSCDYPTAPTAPAQPPTNTMRVPTEARIETEKQSTEGGSVLKNGQSGSKAEASSKPTSSAAKKPLMEVTPTDPTPAEKSEPTDADKIQKPSLNDVPGLNPANGDTGDKSA